MLASFLSAPIIGALLKPLIGGLLDGYKAKLENQTSREAVAADLAKKDIDLQVRESELRAQIVVAEQGSWLTRSVRPVWAAPFIIWTWKVVIWDKVLGWGTTDELGGISGQLIMIIAGAYFIGRSGEKIASIVKRK